MLPEVYCLEPEVTNPTLLFLRAHVEFQALDFEGDIDKLEVKEENEDW